MSITDRAVSKTIEIALEKAVGYIRKDPERDISGMLARVLLPFRAVFPKERIDGLIRGAADRNNPYLRMMTDLALNTDLGIIKKIGVNMGYNAALKGTKKVRALRDKLNCNIPWLILMDPTSACNLRCKGCWAAEYGHKLNLSLDEMQDVVEQGKGMGVYLYMFTGGEPLVRKKDLIKLCENNPDCAFISFTNGTLIDEEFCRDMVRVGNLVPALSIEGDEESNDARRGGGVYKSSIAAMELMREHKCLFGISVCYTRENTESVTSDEFLDKMAALGSKFALYFNFMPVGKNAAKELIPTPAQRKYMYHWIKRARSAKTGKPMFIFDFQDDGEYVGGCIAGGRNYFHINSNGDMEPCVFIHFSDSNIREKKLIDALRSPLFMAYRKGQPFNDNHLRPCPMLENPDALRGIIKSTGAKSTDLVDKETVDELCAKCDDFAFEWQPVADELWETTPHPKIHTQYWRDNPQSPKG